MIYQEVEDLQAAITQGTSIDRLDLSCFTGDYVTGTVTEEYLEWVEKTQLS
jgi:amidophosphoribosyltransferase